MDLTQINPYVAVLAVTLGIIAGALPEPPKFAKIAFAAAYATTIIGIGMFWITPDLLTGLFRTVVVLGAGFVFSLLATILSLALAREVSKGPSAE